MVPLLYWLAHYISRCEGKHGKPPNNLKTRSTFLTSQICSYLLLFVSVTRPSPWVWYTDWQEQITPNLGSQERWAGFSGCLAGCHVSLHNGNNNVPIDIKVVPNESWWSYLSGDVQKSLEIEIGGHSRAHQNSELHWFPWQPKLKF